MTNSRRFSNITRDTSTNTVEVSESILIVCEGEKTEPNYFNKFPVYNVEVVVDGQGRNTISLVEHTIRKLEQNDFDSAWCVFDKDDFPDENFDKSCELALSNNINLAYSIECFELWYLLHFKYFDKDIGRRHYMTDLDAIFYKKFGQKYKKNSENAYEWLLQNNRQKTAIKNAERLAATYAESSNPSEKHPVTYVHNLVMKLNSYDITKRWKSEVEGIAAHINSKIQMVKSIKNCDETLIEDFITKLKSSESNEEIDQLTERFFVKVAENMD